MIWLLFSSRYGVIMKESDCDWFAFPHCTVLIGVDVAHAAWSRHNEAGLHGRGSALCIVQFGVCFPLDGRVGTSHFPSSSNTPGGWPSHPGGLCRPSRRGWPLVPGKAASFPSSGPWHACASHGQGLAAVSVADSVTCFLSRGCRLINAGQVAEVSERSWWSSPRCGARMQPRARGTQRARGQCW